jgi:hypothetical protein
LKTGRLAKEKRVNFDRMNLSLAITAVLAAWAGAACADPVFDTFRHLCLDTGADYPAVASAADADGWKPVDAPVSLVAGVVPTDKLSRGKSIAGADANLEAWRGKTAKNLALADCDVQLGRADFAAAVAEVQGWAGFAPQDNKDQKAIFHFTDVGGAHKSVTPAEYEGAAAASGVEIVTVTGGSGGVNLDLLTIKK